MRIADPDGHLWPHTGRRCSVCRLPTLLDDIHPGCQPVSSAPVAEQPALDLVAQKLGAQRGGQLCSDCRLPLPDATGPGIHVHTACWQNRRAVPLQLPHTRPSKPRRIAVQSGSDAPTATPVNPAADWPTCPGCSQPMATLRSRHERTSCARCELHGVPAHGSDPVVALARQVPQPTRCTGCGQDKHGVVAGRCLLCRLGGPAA